MALDRRDFLRLAATTGLAVAGPLTLVKQAHAAPYEGTFYVTVHAGGGWDPTSLCDPKGAMSAEEDNPMNASYLHDEILTAGNINYAPVGGNQAFFDKYYQELLVLNGIDTSTNGHDSGTRNVWSGKLSEGHPSFTALVAGVKNREAPMAFMSNGGFDFTAGLVAPTRSGNTSALERIAFPNRPNPDDEGRRYHTDDTAARIAQFQADRLAAMQDGAKLQRRKHAMNTLFAARAGENEIRRLTDFLPEELDNSGNPIRRQAQLALAAYKAGLSVSCNLSTGGFDTHGNHDQNHIPRLQTILEGVDFLMEEAERQGVRDKVMVAIGSDFGRTPRYNGTNGKDHWSITSMMLMGPGIAGNRVIGTTTHEHVPVGVNPDTLGVEDGGLRITPEHIHRSLREYAGIHEHELATRHPLSQANTLPLFG